MAKASRKAAGKDTAANVAYEAQLWQMADALRGSMDAAEYKHVVLGLIFLEGQKGGEFYTPRCVVKLLVEMLSVELICAHAKGNANFAWVHEA